MPTFLISGFCQSALLRVSAPLWVLLLVTVFAIICRPPTFCGITTRKKDVKANTKRTTNKADIENHGHMACLATSLFRGRKRSSFMVCYGTISTYVMHWYLLPSLNCSSSWDQCTLILSLLDRISNVDVCGCCVFVLVVYSCLVHRDPSPSLHVNPSSLPIPKSGYCRFLVFWFPVSVLYRCSMASTSPC